MDTGTTHTWFGTTATYHTCSELTIPSQTHQLADGLFGAMHLLPDANTTSSINAISGLPNKAKALTAEKKAFPLVLADNTHFGSHYMTEG